ncbi:hypothetical protein DFJ58DRAFT_772866 [Suillus subalutaceus]|uniref:uncharacterized protein n=1 Tax=Suillus subalutaceus TaxID=48586 RepID=UPI001B86EB7B|nr:uncharacterized protein DFJ58DRAFT_772866 [Suillus subalutaceus]KAG1864154.1 hypothetical protein DFJ58DRAFT_772866 [Suillus subalutaceus]
MSVATRNPFALLDDDRPSTPPPPAEPAAAAPAPQQQTRTRGRGGPASRGGRYYQLDGERKEGRGRGRGRGGDRGGDRGGRGRPFDRHSQTGKTDSDKKVHNSWGGDDGETERKVEEAATNDALAENTNAASGLNDWAGGAAETPADDWAATTDAPKDDWAAPPAAEGGEKPQSGEKRERRGDREEEEDNTLTFDQYPRTTAREGKRTCPQAKSAPKARTKKEEKVFIEIEARFERPSRGGRGGRGGDRGGGERSRGERGRGRGGRGRGGANGYSAPTSSAVNVDDETAFPSLS